MLKKFILSSTTAILLLSSPVHALTDKHAEHNKQVVLDFYEQAINQKDFSAASKYLGSHYTQHNPLVADGAEGLKGIIEYLRANFPESHSEIKKAFVDGDYVVLHVHSMRTPGDRGRAIFDLFKLEDGKIVEHWDTVQDIPEKSANDNGMF